MIIRQQTAIYIEQQKVIQDSIGGIVSTLQLNEHNKQAYRAMLDDMFVRKNGLFTFVIRVSEGNIVDYVLMETVSP